MKLLKVLLVFSFISFSPYGLAESCDKSFAKETNSTTSLAKKSFKVIKKGAGIYIVFSSVLWGTTAFHLVSEMKYRDLDIQSSNIKAEKNEITLAKDKLEEANRSNKQELIQVIDSIRNNPNHKISKSELEVLLLLEELEMSKNKQIESQVKIVVP